MNKLMIIGNLTANPVTRTTSTQSTVCTFTVAVNRRKVSGQNQVTDYFRVSAWNKLGENCQKYLQKGKKAAVTGSVSVSTYTTQNGETRANLEVMAQDVEFLSPASQAANDQPAQQTDDLSGYAVVDGEDLPF